MSRWQTRNWLLLVLGGSGLLGACERRAAPDPVRGLRLEMLAPAPTPEPESAESRACAATLAGLAAEPALAGARVNSGFERGYLLGRARAEPIVFLRTPAFDAEHGSLQARALRAELAAAEHPAFAFERVLAKVKKSPELAREVFLTEGYLYTEPPELAALYVNYLALGLLFREPELRLARGADVWR